MVTKHGLTTLQNENALLNRFTNNMEFHDGFIHPRERVKISREQKTDSPAISSEEFHSFYGSLRLFSNSLCQNLLVARQPDSFGDIGR